ncbi:methyltransferase family protein [Dyadobacter psychrotolerans]|uniref:Isoprenylcysteine carboxylmethyltransferase family protein n=1 Tax=Dyadobacter psychrotolerans TaxID=2541721 RepID=A0A4V2Z342_9BACT|nr:isoprenylcysteine carboxylmethyltransferase family protein [Dyadobacter psychrotolerans]TDE11318.1 isoprenylcysteine carboxylmethyltransferase family protein [Dyadobacter psychrotolerans]
MISIGNFFFKYRNNLFIFLYLLLFVPSPQLFSTETFGEKYYFFPIILGLIVTFLGEIIRGITIGLAYIIRGGRDKKVYAEKLVTEGIFNHCRNPLYVGNILMLLGVGILSNSLFYVGIVMPAFLFIYQAIVLAEENFLRNKFGAQFDQYCSRVNRWLISLSGIGTTMSGMHFNYKRWILKEYNTLLVWLIGITAILLFKYPELTPDSNTRITIFAVIVILLGIIYGYVRYLKKSGKMSDSIA